MKKVIMGLIVIGCLSGTVVFSETIHPVVRSIKYWLTYPGADGLDNGMRKSMTYSNASHQISGSTVTYGVMQSSAISRTLKFLSEYYLAYQGELSSSARLYLYNDIKNYAELILRHRKYVNGWGWSLTDSADLADGNLEVNKFYYGGVATASTYTMFTALGNSFACEALVAAAEVADLRNDVAHEDQWLDAAVLVGDFLCRLADPYDDYSYCMLSDQGNPIEKVGMVYGMVSAAETLYTEIGLQNLYSIVALKDLAAAASEPSYLEMAFQIRNQMCIGLANDIYQGYYPRCSTNVPSIVVNDFDDNAWHAPIYANAPQVGDDHIEYGLAALWRFHDLSSTNYTFVYTNGGTKSFNMSDKAGRFQNVPAQAAGVTNYDSCISFTGYFRNDGGTWKAWMPYYDMVGFGLLGELRNAVYHSDYTNAWQQVVQSKVDAGDEGDLQFVMLDSDLDVYWASNNKTSKGTLPVVAIGLSLMEITPYDGDLP